MGQGPLLGASKSQLEGTGNFRPLHNILSLLVYTVKVSCDFSSINTSHPVLHVGIQFPADRYNDPVLIKCVECLNRRKTSKCFAGGWRGHMRLHPTKLLI